MSLSFTILGQIKSGKNHMIVTRRGRHFPEPKWGKWRDDAVRQIKEQLPEDFQTIEKRCKISFFYTPSDGRKRDAPGMMDALFHCLEVRKNKDGNEVCAGVISDDTLFKEVQWLECAINRGSPGCKIEIETEE